jgi:hypothetical protein
LGSGERAFEIGEQPFEDDSSQIGCAALSFSFGSVKRIPMKGQLIAVI